jgi:hypothetical protein
MYVIGAGLAALLLVGCNWSHVRTTPEDSGTGTPAGAASPREAGVGDTIELSDGAHRVSVTLTHIVDPARPGAQVDAPGNGRKLVAVQFTWANRGDATYDNAPLLTVKVIDGEGQRFDAKLVFTDTSAGVNARGGAIAPGDTERGFVAFAVPEGATVARVQFRLGMVSREVAQWTVAG